MGQVRSSLQMRRGADFFILVSVVVLVGALLDWSSARGLQASALQADSFRPLDVVGLDGAASLCPGLRTGHPTFLRQRMAALVRGRLWSSPGEGMEEGCEGPSVVVSMAERSLVILACLLALACLLSALFLPRRQLAQLEPGKWLAQLRTVLLSVWTRRKAEQRKQSAALLLRSAMRSGDKECLSAALEEAEDAKVDVPLLRRATVALRELRRKAAKVAKKGKSSRGDPAHRRSASPTRRRRSSRSASPGAGSRASDGAPRPTEAESVPPFLQGSSESSGDFSIPAGKAGTTHAGGLDTKDTGGSPKAGPAREADRGSPPLSSEPSMSLSQQSSLSAHSAATPQPAAPPQPERQNSDRHAQHHGGGKGPHLVRDSVGELAAAVAMKVEAIEKERERQREEKRQMRSKEAAERAAAAAQEKAADVANVKATAKPEKAETGANTPEAAGRAASFFGRKAAPVGTASPAGSGNGGDREWRWAGGKKEKPVAVPIEPVTPRPARRTPAVVLTVPRPQPSGIGRGAGNGKGDAGKKQAAPGTPVSPTTATALPGWTKKFSRHTSSAPTTPNGKYDPGPDGALPAGQGLAAASLLGQPPEPPPPPPAQPPRLYAQVARDGTGTQQERPSTAPPSGKRTPPPSAQATPASPRFENGNGMFAAAFPPASDPTAMMGAHQPSSSLFLGLGGFAGFMGGGHAPPQASAAEALSPFPGMSLHRRVAPPVRGPAVQGGSDVGLQARGLPSYNAMPLVPPSIPYRNFDNIWSSASTVDPLPIGTSPPGWNPMGMRCRTSAAPEWKPVPGPGLSPLQFASDPLPPLEATLFENPPAAAAAAAVPVITGALSERSASGSVTGPSASHFSSVSTSSSLEGW
ncbi:hypothetical protein COCOBI_17-2470 [Coccomyxa sp. Obi]|nr:hypothetical protein COCOBI_17-2470 [Coccomyxa sp. Obi]